MKFEEQIKQSLNNHEEAYNPAAWDAMKAKLDAKHPVAPKGGNGKWWIAAGIAAVAITSLLIWNNSTTSTNPIAEQTQENISEDSGRMDSNAKNNPQSTSTNDLTAQSAEGNSETAPNNVESIELDENLDNSPELISSNDENNSNETIEVIDVTSSNSENSNSAGQGVERIQTQILPIRFKVNTNSLCLGSNLIKNENKHTMTILDENKNTLATIDANNSKKINLSEAGMIHIGYFLKGTYHNKKSILVENAPEISVQRVDEEIKYEEGLPVVRFVSDENLSWSANGQNISGKEATFHFFNQGTETIKLTQNYDGSCATSKEISVNVEKYNLLAPTAFNPKGFNKTFIPKALEVRDVSFKMVIIDMSNGGIVYETTDANQPWNGVDVRTGRIADEPIKYAWKVQIINPEKGEPSNYQGTVRKL